MRLHVVDQNFQAYITQVFWRDALQHINTTGLRLIRTEARHEITKNLMVTTRSNQQFSNNIFIQFIILRKLACAFLCHESSNISITDRIFNCHATAVFCSLFRSYFWHDGTFDRWNDVQINGISFTCFLVQFNDNFFVFTERNLSITELTILWCPNQHVTLTSRKECLAFSIAALGCNCIEFSIVIYLEFNLCISYRFTFSVYNLYICLSGWSVIANDVDFSIVRILMHDFFRTIIATEYFCMHQHSTISRSIEPTQIQNRFRFASTQEIPLSVYPSFHPSMVVVSVCPTRSVHLASRNTYWTQSCYRKSRFFTTTAISSLYRCQRRTCTRVWWSINHLFMTPVVHFQNRIMQRKVLHTVFQLFIEHLTAIVQILIIDTDWENEMTEFAFWNQLTPRHFFFCLQRIINIFQKEFTWIVGDVP